MTSPTQVKQVLAVIPPLAGGRALGARFSSIYGADVEVTVVEAADEDKAALSKAQVIFTGLGPVTAEHIAAAPALKLIQCASHGFDYVDLAAARSRGVVVCNIGSSWAEVQDVAEQTFGLMLALAKQLIARAHRPDAGGLGAAQAAAVHHRTAWQDPGHRRVRPHWPAGRPPRGRLRHEHCLRRPERRVDRLADRLQARRVELDELMRISDYVTVHAPLTGATRNLIDAERLALLKPTAFVINTARGAVIDQDALADALEAHRIAGAGIDVFDPEPPTAALRLLSAPNVVLSPHVGGVTRETLARIAMAAASNVKAYLAGKPPADVVS